MNSWKSDCKEGIPVETYRFEKSLGVDVATAIGGEVKVIWLRPDK